MPDHLAEYLRASVAGDVDALLATLTPDAELVSPISGRMRFSGREDLRHLTAAVYGTLRGLEWDAPIGDGARRVAVGRARVGPFALTDAMVFDLAEDGRIRRVGPHLRPWLALTTFALLLGPKVARRPGVVVRALRA